MLSSEAFKRLQVSFLSSEDASALAYTTVCGAHLTHLLCLCRVSLDK